VTHTPEGVAYTGLCPTPTQEWLAGLRIGGQPILNVIYFLHTVNWKVSKENLIYGGISK